MNRPPRAVGKFRVGLVVMCLAVAAAPQRTSGQIVRGVVVDSASRLPIPGAVITTLDSAGRVGRRSLSGERGTYFVTAPSAARRLRVVRLGFRPVDVDVPIRRDSVAIIDIEMTRIPYQLQAVRVTGGASCPRRSDRAAALSLLEQARAGLLATVVARSEHPARMKRLMIDRRMDGTSDRISRHHVRVEMVPSAVAAFRAARSGADFIQQGFATESRDGATFHAPDADVLLDDGFANGYCFHIMARDRSRPNQVGLGFRAANRRRGRIDVDGALWIDTVARALVDIEYAYVGMDPRANRFAPGGRVEFRALPNGVVLIDRWLLRLVGAEGDSAGGFPTPASRETGLVVSEVGGELARATWPDGFAWAADLGRLFLTVTDDRGVPRQHTIVRLDDTDYEATTDSVGHLEIVDLAPGPYSAHIVDRRLDPIRLTLETSLSFVAARTVTNVLTVKAVTAEDFVGGLCRKDPVAADYVGAKPTQREAWVIGRVIAPNGNPVGGVWVSSPPAWFETATDGLFAFCRLPRDSTVSFTLRKDNKTVGRISRHLVDPLTVIPVQIDLERKPEARDRSRTSND